MNASQRATIGALAAALVAVGWIGHTFGLVPAAVVLWMGSFATIVAVLRYEDAEHETAGPDPVDPVADVVVVSEPVLSLVETGTHGPLGKLTHHHPRQRAHEPLQARA